MKKIYIIATLLITHNFYASFARTHPGYFHQESPISSDSNSSYYPSDDNTSYTPAQSSTNSYPTNESSSSKSYSNNSNISYATPTQTKYNATSLGTNIGKSQASTPIKDITVSVYAQTNSTFDQPEQVTLTFQDIFVRSDLTEGLELTIIVLPASTMSASPRGTFDTAQPAYMVIALIKTLDGLTLSKTHQTTTFKKIPDTINVQYGSTLIKTKRFFQPSSSITLDANMQQFHIKSPITTTINLATFNGVLVAM